MWFLLLQIFILMLLAAALGAALMWWWLSRKHEAIAASRERLLAQTNRIDGLATRDDVAKLNEEARATLGYETARGRTPRSRGISSDVIPAA